MTYVIEDRHKTNGNLSNDGHKARRKKKVYRLSGRGYKVYLTVLMNLQTSRPKREMKR